MKNHNAEWWRTVTAHGVSFTVLVPPKHVTPGLKSPYEYIRKLQEIIALETALKKLSKSERKNLQCDLVEVKTLKYGRRFDLFFLGCPEGWFKEYSGHTKLKWDNLGEALVFTLRDLEDAKPYIGEWAPDKKFQMRYEVYLAAEELL